MANHSMTTAFQNIQTMLQMAAVNDRVETFDEVNAISFIRILKNSFFQCNADMQDLLNVLILLHNNRHGFNEKMKRSEMNACLDCSRSFNHFEPCERIVVKHQSNKIIVGMGVMQLLYALSLKNVQQVAFQTEFQYQDESSIINDLTVFETIWLNEAFDKGVLTKDDLHIIQFEITPCDNKLIATPLHQIKQRVPALLPNDDNLIRATHNDFLVRVAIKEAKTVAQLISAITQVAGFTNPATQVELKLSGNKYTSANAWEALCAMDSNQELLVTKYNNRTIHVAFK